MENNEEKFKLMTRRWVAWIVIAMAAIASLVIVSLGIWNNDMTMVVFGGQFLFVEAAGVTGYYFGKSTKEE